MGSRFRQRTRSAAIVSFSLQLTPVACKSSLNVDRQVFFGRPLYLLPSAGVHSISRRAWRSGAIRMTWPANRNLLSPTMSCSRLCPVRAIVLLRLIPCLSMWLQWSFSSFVDEIHLACSVSSVFSNKGRESLLQVATKYKVAIRFEITNARTLRLMKESSPVSST